MIIRDIKTGENTVEVKRWDMMKSSYPKNSITFIGDILSYSRNTRTEVKAKESIDLIQPFRIITAHLYGGSHGNWTDVK